MNIVRILLWGLLLLLLPLVTRGQMDDEAVRPRFGGGVTAGVVGSQVDGDTHGGYHRLNGTGGVWVERELAGRFALRIELRYIGKGSLANRREGGARRLEYSLGLHYIEVPLLVHYSLGAHWYVGLGVAGGYLMGWQERNAHGDDLRASRTRVRSYEVSALGRVGWRITDSWSVRFGAGYSIMPIRGRLGAVGAGYRSGQYNNYLELSLDYEI